MADFGYDIADYRDVDPLFGNLGDFERLLAKAHGLGIKVMIDQVLSHCSVEHEWFRQSSESRDNPKADWYVWADAKPDGTPPNNWMSLFGGVAWRWEPRRGQYYLHNFLSSQPTSLPQPEVRQATLDNVEFWLQKGVDGFRLDAINFCSTTGNCATTRRSHRKSASAAVQSRQSHAFQYHHYNNTRREPGVLEELRALLDRYPGATRWARSRRRTRWRHWRIRQQAPLHMGYSFELLTDDFSAATSAAPPRPWKRRWRWLAVLGDSNTMCSARSRAGAERGER